MAAGIRGALALTFDDGPGPETGRILDCFEAHGASGTFFLLGRHVEQRPELVRRMLELGCEVGNHTASHPRLSTVDEAETEAELTACSAAIAAAAGVRPSVMRPPYGDYGPATLRVASRLGLRVVLWSIPTRDFEADDARLVAERVVENAYGGGIVVLHDGSAEGDDRTVTAEAVELAVPELQARGYRLVTVSELLRLDRRVRWEVVPTRRGSPAWAAAALGRRLTRPLAAAGGPAGTP
jgi:peptidoglycan/xylan/chitin deacetylase (PgdA/CDA1 family)